MFGSIFIIVIALLLIGYFVKVVLYDRKTGDETKSKPEIYISAGKDMYSLDHTPVNRTINIPLRDFNVISLFINTHEDIDELDLSWSSSFLEKDYTYKLPDKLSLFNNHATIAIRLRDFTIDECKDRAHEKLFLNIYNGNQNLGIYQIVVWYDCNPRN